MNKISNTVTMVQSIEDLLLALRRDQLRLRRLIQRLRRWRTLVPISWVTSGPKTTIGSLWVTSIVVPCLLVWVHIGVVVMGMSRLLKRVIRR